MISCCNKYVQIQLFKDSGLLQKVMTYTKKHFTHRYHLSSSLLILDDGEEFKKNYLINWCAYASNLDSENCLKNALDNSHLPIRIKIVGQKAMLEVVSIEVNVLSNNKVVLRLNKDNFLAKRYIRSRFIEFVEGIYKNEIYLNASSEYFWEKLMNLISHKVIHNIILHFEYSSFTHESFYLTKEEKILRRSYALLESKFGDDFLKVKKQYLKLAKEYHPDNAYGKSDEILSIYNYKFRQINEAYKTIKSSIPLAS